MQAFHAFAGLLLSVTFIFDFDIHAVAPSASTLPLVTLQPLSEEVDGLPHTIWQEGHIFEASTDAPARFPHFPNRLGGGHCTYHMFKLVYCTA